MAAKNVNIPIIFLYIFFIFALIIYLNGFFPIENSFHDIKIGSHKRYDADKYINKYKFDKLVLLVIDALRYDFVFPTTNKIYMPFTTSSIFNNNSCLMKLRAQSPTVTMPRLKAMTSGIVPTYFDVVSNFMSEEFKSDSFIQQAVLSNLRIVFYGDDTWIKLFPNAFVRSEGTTSFFASDYTEVDYNVTRHLDKEFQKKDWDFLILHYLGLDHIGHMEGPMSSLIKPKLKEMDDIVLKIFKYLQKMEEEDVKTLFILTSDHGMKDSGGHGGVTEPEILLPLVSVGKACNNVPGWPKDYIPQQIDLSPTISIAFGLSIPHNNVGKLIPTLLHRMDMENVLQMLELNRNQLRLRTARPENDNDNFMSQTTQKRSDQLENHSKLEGKVKNYFREMSELSDSLRNVSSFKIIYLVLSVAFMWFILALMIIKLIQKFNGPRNIIHYFLILGTFLRGLSFASTSMIEEEHQIWYFLWVTMCILIVMDILSWNKFSFSHNIKEAMPWIAILIAHRILRKLNQTGDKWAMLPDIKGFLNSPKNQTFLTVTYILGLAMLLLFVFNESNERCTKGHLIFTSAVLVNVSYRISVSSIIIDNLNFYPKSRGNLECSLFWILVVFFAIISKNLALMWTLVASILVKPHNIVLLPAALYVNKQINKFYREPKDTLWNSMTHFWAGFVFYFYQGNGNSIANVDVSPGFTGLNEYNLLYSFFMVAIHTNMSHILAYSLASHSHLINSILWLFPVTVYCTLLMFQLNHLFIWSVFSPKLLYETNFSFIYLFLLCLDHLCNLKYFNFNLDSKKTESCRN